MSVTRHLPAFSHPQPPPPAEHTPKAVSHSPQPMRWPKEPAEPSGNPTFLFSNHSHWNFRERACGGWRVGVRNISLQNPGLWEALPSQQSPKGDAATGYIPVCLSFRALADIGPKGFCFFYLLLFYFIMEAWACVSMYSCLCVCRHTCAQGDTHVCMRSVSGIMPQELSTLLSGDRVSQLGLGDLPVSTSPTGCKCTPPQLSL